MKESSNSPRLNLKIPYAPIFKSKEERIMLTGVGACECASGNQLCNGKIGSFTPKPINNSMNSEFFIQL